MMEPSGTGPMMPGKYDVGTLPAPPALPKDPLISGGIKQIAPDKPGGQATAKQACMQYKLGRCWFGANCKRRHDEPPKRLTAKQIFDRQQAMFQSGGGKPPAVPPPPPPT